MKRKRPSKSRHDDDGGASASNNPPPKKMSKFEETADAYEKTSFTHRKDVTHVLDTKTQLLITAGADGYVKLWKRLRNGGGGGVEFVNGFQAHPGRIAHIAVNFDGTLLSTISADDECMKVFHIVDSVRIMNTTKLGFSPRTCAWIDNRASSDPIAAVAVSDRDSPSVYVFDGTSSNDDDEPLRILDKLHRSSVVLIAYNAKYECAISIDDSGAIRCWTGPNHNYERPSTVKKWRKKTSDLKVLTESKVISIAVSPNGENFVTFSDDWKMRIFSFATGQLEGVLDESVQFYANDKETYRLSNPEMELRVAAEKKLRQASNMETSIRLARIIYDESGTILLYPTMVGIKMIDAETRRCIRIIGPGETHRFLSICLLRPPPFGAKSAGTSSSSLSTDNPAIREGVSDPMVVCSAFKSRHLFTFSIDEGKRKNDNASVEEPGISNSEEDPAAIKLINLLKPYLPDESRGKWGPLLSMFETMETIIKRKDAVIKEKDADLIASLKEQLKMTQVHFRYAASVLISRSTLEYMEIELFNTWYPSRVERWHTFLSNQKEGREIFHAIRKVERRISQKKVAKCIIAYYALLSTAIHKFVSEGVGFYETRTPPCVTTLLESAKAKWPNI